MKGRGLASSSVDGTGDTHTPGSDIGSPLGAPAAVTPGEVLSGSESGSDKYSSRITSRRESKSSKLKGGVGGISRTSSREVRKLNQMMIRI